MEIEKRGGLITVQGFWDCACDVDYIHREAVETYCAVCDSHAEDMPDSMLNEILIYFGSKLSVYERQELVGYLMVLLEKKGINGY